MTDEPMTPLSAKKHLAATRKVSRTIEAVYGRAFPGEMAAPEVFWNFILSEEDRLRDSLREAGENNSQIQRACDTFVGLFKKACVRARKLINDGKQAGEDDAAGGPVPGGKAAWQAVEDAKRPEDYLFGSCHLWGEGAG